MNSCILSPEPRKRHRDHAVSKKEVQGRYRRSCNDSTGWVQLSIQGRGGSEAPDKARLVIDPLETSQPLTCPLSRSKKKQQLLVLGDPQLSAAKVVLSISLFPLP